MLIKIILDLFTKGFLWFSLTTFSKLFRLLSFFERLEAFTFNNFTRFAVPSKIWNIYWNRFLWWKLDYIVALVFELLTYFICAFIIFSCYSFQHYCYWLLLLLIFNIIVIDWYWSYPISSGKSYWLLINLLNALQSSIQIFYILNLIAALMKLLPHYNSSAKP